MKKIFSLLMSSIFLCNLIFAGDVSTIISGGCGATYNDSVVWSISSDSTFTLSGIGRTKDYIFKKDIPWYENRTLIKKGVVEEGISYIGTGVFSDFTEMVEVSLPKSITELGVTVFLECNNLLKIVFPDSLKFIPAYECKKCRSLIYAEIPEKVESLDDNSFQECKSLKCMVLKPTTPPDVYGNTFDGVDLKNLTVYVPEGCVESYKKASEWKKMTNILEYNPDTLFSITVSADPAHGTVKGAGNMKIGQTGVITAIANDGCTFARWSDGNTDNPRIIVAYSDAEYKAQFKAPKVIDSGKCGLAAEDSVVWRVTEDSVLTISGKGRTNKYIWLKDIPWQKHNSLIKKAVVSDGITFLGSGLLSDLHSLVEVDLSNTITELDITVFFNSDTLPKIVFPDSIPYIPGYQCKGCSSLIYAEIPGKVNSLDDKCFMDCKSLSCLVLKPTTPPDVYGDTFTGVDVENLKIYVPKGAVEAYSKDVDWKKMKNFIEYNPDTIFSVTVSADVLQGSVTGACDMKIGQTGVITATANEGYNFEKWSDGNTDNPRIIVAYSDIDYKAQFAEVSTAVENVEDSSVCLYAVNGILSITGNSENYTVYNVSGAVVAEGVGNGVVSELTHGIYVVRIGNKGYKIAM